MSLGVVGRWGRFCSFSIVKVSSCPLNIIRSDIVGQDSGADGFLLLINVAGSSSNVSR